MNDRPKEYFDQILEQNFWFFLGWPPEDFIEFISKGMDVSDLDLSASNGCVVCAPNDILMIWTKTEHPAFVAHECLHAVNRSFSRIGYRPDVENDEMQARFLGKLLDFIYKEE